MGYTPVWFDWVKGAGYWSLKPPVSVSTDDLYINPNSIDGYAQITLYGLGQISLKHYAGTYIEIKDGSTQYLKISYATPDAIIEGTIDTKNLYLKTTGTGNVKFGTYTAGAATDSTGFITILDAAGNVRKLMVQA